MTQGDDAAMVSGEGDLVLVPHAPGPLVRPTSGRRRDELDDLVDDLFGEPDARGPSALDGVLVVAGLGIASWGAVSGPAVGWLVVGIVLLLLGAVLPVRSAWRRVTGARDSRRRAALHEVGTVLAVDDPDVAGIVHGYDALLESTRGVDPDLAGRAIAAGHAAMAEVASLLDGARPASDVEREYVAERRDAIEALQRSVQLARPSEVDSGAPDRWLVAEARRELDAATGDGSIERLDALRRELDGGP